MTTVSTNVDKLHQSVNEHSEKMKGLEKAIEEIQVSNDDLKSQLSLTQQLLSEMQKNNEALQQSNTHLQDQLSIAQNQLSLIHQQLLVVTKNA